MRLIVPSRIGIDAYMRAGCTTLGCDEHFTVDEVV
jgi:hypothetical protein